MFLFRVLEVHFVLLWGFLFLPLSSSFPTPPMQVASEMTARRKFLHALNTRASETVPRDVSPHYRLDRLLLVVNAFLLFPTCHVEVFY